MKNYTIENDIYEEYKNGLCFFSQNSLPRSTIASAHIHSTIEILYIKKGRFTICIDDKLYHVCAGDAFLFRSNTIHYIISGNEEENFYYVLKIRPSALETLATPDYEEVYSLSFTMTMQEQKCLWTKEELDGSASQIKNGFELLIRAYESNEGYFDISKKIATEMILLGVIKNGGDAPVNTIVQIGKESTQLIYEAMSYMREHFTEDITCEKLSKKFNMSYSYFSRTLKSVTGYTFRQNLNYMRICHAESLIVNTNKSITEICHECGFNNAAYFSDVYKKMKGCAPHTSRTGKI